MIYYTSDLIIKINSNNQTERKSAENEWKKNDELYNKYFSEIIDKLPQKFIKLYLKYRGFHDYLIKSINIINGKKNRESKISIVINIENQDNSFSIKFVGVKRYKISVPDLNNLMCGEMNWGYTEFELLEYELYKQNILCDFDSEIEIEFKNIVIKNNKSNG
jgi:hypothetical protein